MIIGEVYSNNKPVLVVLELNPLGHDDIQLDEFKIASAYSKDNAQYLINSSELLYIDKNKKRVRNREKRTGLLLPVGSSVPNSDSNISQNKTAVNTEYEQKSKDDTPKISLAKPVERTKELIAVHNLTLEELMKSLEQSHLENLNSLDEYKFSLQKKNLESKDKKKYNKSKNKYTRYSEYDTLLMQWIYSPGVPVGDMKAFTDSKGNIRFFEKTEGGCVEITSKEFDSIRYGQDGAEYDKAEVSVDTDIEKNGVGKRRNIESDAVYGYSSNGRGNVNNSEGEELQNERERNLERGRRYSEEAPEVKHSLQKTSAAEKVKNNLIKQNKNLRVT